MRITKKPSLVCCIPQVYLTRSFLGGGLLEDQEYWIKASHVPGLELPCAGAAAPLCFGANTVIASSNSWASEYSLIFTRCYLSLPSKGDQRH